MSELSKLRNFIKIKIRINHNLLIFTKIFDLNTYVDKLLKIIMGLKETLSKFCIMKSVREKAKEKEPEKDKED